MPATYTLIASNTLSSSAASVTFSSIPATYTDLVLRYSARNTGTNNGGSSLTIKINGSSATNYSMTRLRATSSTASSDRFTADSAFYTYLTVNSDGMTANIYSSGELYFPNYAGSANKVASAFGVMEENSTVTWGIDADAFLRSVTDAITSLDLTTSNSFKSGSSFFLYGIKNS